MTISTLHHNRSKSSMSLSAVMLALVLIVSACADAGTDRGSASDAEVRRGGTLRAALLVDVSAGFDPQKEYYVTSWTLFRCCLLRTLMGYPGLPAEEGGDETQPDLAAREPTVSDDGLTWTFELKRGLTYAPPFEDTQIVAQDIIRALERTADPEASVNGYSFYFSVIEGFDDFSAGKTERITGLDAPDDHTLEITLTRPAGDLPYLMAMPATAPIPPGAADGHVKDYGRYLVASGPYMLEGSDALDFDLPVEDQEPVSGYLPGRAITLVRNPSWDASTDPLRPAYVDRVEISVGGTREDIANKVEAGELDLQLDGDPPSHQIREYEADPQKRDQLFSNPSDGVAYLTMNVAEPPFDDVAVRRAINYAIDKESMRTLLGGPLHGDIANHAIVDTLEDDLLADFDPFPTGGRGDIEAAQEEMSRSRYDSDQDGVCDHPSCDGILTLTAEADPFPDQAALISDNLEPLGIELDLKVLEVGTMFDRCLDPSAHTAFCLGGGWSKDYPDAVTFAEPLFGSASLGPDACCNDSLVSASPEHLRKYGYDVTQVPNVDDRIAECVPLTGRDRVECWADFDRYITEEVVPWVPYLFQKDVDIVSSRVRNYTFDQFGLTVAIDRLSLAPDN